MPQTFPKVLTPVLLLETSAKGSHAVAATAETTTAAAVASAVAVAVAVAARHCQSNVLDGNEETTMVARPCRAELG